MAAARSTYLLEGTEDNGQILRYMVFHYDKKKKNETVRNIATTLLPKLFESYDKVFEILFNFMNLN